MVCNTSPVGDLRTCQILKKAFLLSQTPRKLVFSMLLKKINLAYKCIQMKEFYTIRSILKDQFDQSTEIQTLANFVCTMYLETI